MPKVLVVDDSDVDRRRVCGLLRKDPDMIVDCAANGVDALEQIKQDAPDLVLTDLIMPEMNGLELVANLVTQHPLIPAILMTGRGSEQIAVEALQAGAASYVPKRMLATMLLDTVRNVLDAAQQERCEAQLMNCLTHSENAFKLSADPCMIPPLVNHLHQTMRLMGICDEADGIRVCVALEEAINNALFHGNLEISSEQRTGDLDIYRQLVEHRCKNTPFCNRFVNVEAKITRQGARFIVRDEGPGFDPGCLPDPTDPDNLEKACGRGLLLMQTFMDQVDFNGNGNEVTMVKHASRKVRAYDNQGSRAADTSAETATKRSAH